MRKKILDILPSKKSATPEKKAISKSKKEYLQLYKQYKMLVILGSVVALMLVVVLVLTFKAKAFLEISPRQELFKIEDYVKINPAVSEIDFASHIVPGQVFAQEKEMGQDFPSTGKNVKEGRAGGTIQVFNATNPPRAITLRPETRFLSAKDSKIFKTSKKVYLPSPLQKSGKIEPSITNVEVLAAEAGESYNIAPSKFSVPGLAGTAYYFTVWAESPGAMTGGFLQETKKVTGEDIERAKELLEEKLLAEAKSVLKNAVENEYVLEDASLSIAEKNIFCLTEEGKEAPSFNCQAKIKVEGLGAKKSLLKELGKTLIAEKILASQVINEETLWVEASFESYDVANEQALMTLQVSAKIYKQIEEELIKQSIAGKKEKEIQGVIAELFPELTKIGTRFWPFWVKKVPDDLRRIEIRVKTH